MKLFLPILILCLFCCVGCGIKSEVAGDASSKASLDEQSKGDTSEQTAAVQNTPDNKPATRTDLDQYMSRFKDDSIWQYNERTEGELAGIWISEDGDRVEFDVDGVKGSFSESFSGNMTAGLYAVSDDGRIAAFSKSNGIGLGSHFKFKGQALVGPKGRKASIKWKRLNTTQ